METTLRACAHKYVRGPLSCCLSVSPSPNVVLATFCALALPILYLCVWSGVWRITGSDGARLALCCIRASQLNGRSRDPEWSSGARAQGAKAYRTGSARGMRRSRLWSFYSLRRPFVPEGKSRSRAHRRGTPRLLTMHPTLQAAASAWCTALTPLAWGKSLGTQQLQLNAAPVISQ